MGGPKSPVRIGGGGTEVKLPKVDLIGGIKKGAESVMGATHIGRAAAATREALADYERRRPAMEAQAALDNRAKEWGFANEADRVAQVSRIIDSFGKVKNGRLPAALSGLGPKTGYSGPIKGIMTKGQ